jgi:hypothetical protein
MADQNRHSVDARAASRMVLVRSHAERIVVLLGDEIVADHPRHFRRDQIIYDPWHYLPVLFSNSGFGCQALHEHPCRAHCSLIPGLAVRCRPGCGWNSVWRDLR